MSTEEILPDDGEPIDSDESSPTEDADHLIAMTESSENAQNNGDSAILPPPDENRYHYIIPGS